MDDAGHPSSCSDHRFLVIGGGIAGAACARELKRICPSSKVALVSPSSTIKDLRDVEQITPLLSAVDVHERSQAAFALDHPGITIVRDEVTSVDPVRSQAMLASGDTIIFARCCVATGASPALAALHERVIGIRDTESVADLKKRLLHARRVLIVGNGGIALELVHALTAADLCQVVWAVRDSYVGNTFFDASASAFVLPSLSPHIVKASEITEKTTGAVPSASSFCNISSDTRRHTLHGNGRAKTAILTNTQASPAMSAIRSSSGSAGDICVDSTRGGNGPRSTVSSEHWQADEFAARRSDGSIEGNWSKVFGAGLGPDWAAMFNDQEAPENSGSHEKRPHQSMDPDDKARLDMQFECELDEISDGDSVEDQSGTSWPVYATLTNGVVVGCDFIVSATGVRPNTGVLGADFKRGHDGGLMVDEMMRVRRRFDMSKTQELRDSDNCNAVNDQPRAVDVPNHTLFAAGDCCCIEWPKRESAHWFQMRLWSQARAMGLFAAKCMADCVDELGSGGAFDLFVHATRFFGHKVALLGHYNGQSLGSPIQDFVSRQLVVDSVREVRGEEEVAGSQRGVQDKPCTNDGRSEFSDAEAGYISEPNRGVEVLVRTTPGTEYIKVIVEEGRIRGAMLIGDTGLEETFENLILNETDVSDMAVNLLNPDVDIEDFFD